MGIRALFAASGKWLHELVQNSPTPEASWGINVAPAEARAIIPNEALIELARCIECDAVIKEHCVNAPSLEIDIDRESGKHFFGVVYFIDPDPQDLTVYVDIARRFVALISPFADAYGLVGMCFKIHWIQTAVTNPRKIKRSKKIFVARIDSGRSGDFLALADCDFEKPSLGGAVTWKVYGGEWGYGVWI